MLGLRTLCFAAYGLCLIRPAFGAVVYVDRTAQPGGNGSSWAGAFADLGAALATLQPGDELRIAQGLYKPTGPGGDRNATFALKGGTVVRGGFAGRASSTPDQQDPQAFPTILSGDLNGDDGPGWTNRADNSHHIATLDLGSGLAFQFLGETVLDGITFRGGEADLESGAINRGAALRATAPDGFGGEITATLKVSRCRFERSRAWRGGAAHTTNIVATFERCVFVGNSAATGGGAEHIFAAFFSASPTARFIRCDFIGNTATFGGAFSVVDQNATIDSCRFLDNAADFGGAIVTPGAQELTLVNSLFAGNTAISGAALFDDGAFITQILNCTFSANTGTMLTPVENNGTVIESRAILPLVVRNSIVWGNLGIMPQVSSFALEVGFSAIEGGHAGAGNIAADPRFVDPGAGDYRLRPSSPCADAGDTGAVPAGVSLDLAGRPRIVDDPAAPGAGVDMGAYERQVCPGDATGDLLVTFADLNVVLGAFGQTGAPGSVIGDLNGDGAVTFADLNAVLGAFGGGC